MLALASILFYYEVLIMGKNYIRLKNRIPFKSTFCFIDTVDYIADEIFFNHEFHKKVKLSPNELHKRGSDFVIVKCTIPTKDIPTFEMCMEHLRRKIEFLDYDMEEHDELANFFEIIEENTGELSYE